MNKIKRIYFIDQLRSLYFIYCFIVTIASNYYNQFSFFKISLTILLSEKSMSIIFQFSKKLDDDNVSMLRKILLNYCNHEEELCHTYKQLVTIYYIAFILYDALLHYDMFYLGTIYSNDIQVFAFLKIGQIILGYAIKIHLVIFIISNEGVEFSIIEFFQSISLIAGVSTLQGLSALFLQDQNKIIFILVWKVCSSYICLYFCKMNSLPLYGSNAGTRNQFVIIFVIDIINLQYDCAPFYNFKEYLKNTNDIRFVALQTQKSLKVLKLGQLIETIMMMSLFQYSTSAITSKVAIFYYYYILCCFTLNAILSIYTILSALIADITYNHAIFSQNSISMDKLIPIIKNSSRADLLSVLQVTGKEDYFKSASREQRNSILNYLLAFGNKQASIISIDQIYKKERQLIKINAKYLLDSLVSMIENYETLPIVQLDYSPQRKSVEFDIIKSIQNRLYKCGFNENTLAFMKYQKKSFTLQYNLSNALNRYQSELLKIILFHRFQYSQFTMNPYQIYYDLFDSN